MKYLLLCPRGHLPEWAGREAGREPTVRMLGDLKCGMVLYYCDGQDPPGGATGCIMDGEKGEVAWWPVWQAPPPPVYGLISETGPDRAEGESGS